MADAIIRLAYKNSAWFTTNAALVLGAGRVVFLSGTRTFKVGDGSTALSALTFYDASGAGSTPGLSDVLSQNPSGGGLEITEIAEPSAFDSAATKMYTDNAAAQRQPLDATLTALAGVTTAANKIIYATGSDAFSTTDFTPGAWTDYSATVASGATGFSSISTNTARYAVKGKELTMHIRVVGASNATTLTLPLPPGFTAANTDIQRAPLISVTNNGTNQTGIIQTTANNATLTVFATAAAGPFTASGTKAVTCVFTIETL